MTRKKWNRLRRQRPELFSGISLPSWEAAYPPDLLSLKRLSKAQVIAIMTAFQFKRSLGDLVISDLGDLPLTPWIPPGVRSNRAVIHNLAGGTKPYNPEDLSAFVNKL
jgi:hypothetical protein